MRIYIGFILSLSFLGLLSCEHTDHTEELRTIDSLVFELDSAILDYRLIDTNGYHEASQKISSRLGFIEKGYAEDTMSRDVAMLMANYRELKKPFQRFTMKYNEVGKELDFSRNQLITLKHDLQSNLLDSNLVNRMVQTEREAASKVINDVEELKLSRKTTWEKRERLEPRVDSLIQVIKKDTLS